MAWRIPPALVDLSTGAVSGAFAQMNLWHDAPVRLLIRVLLAAFTVSWWVVPAMGVIDLTVTWDEDWLVVLEAGWGMVMTVGVGMPFLLAAVRPSLAGPALVQVYVVTVALLAGAVLGVEPQTWWVFAMLAIEVPFLHLLAGREPAPRRGRHLPLLVLAVLSSPAWVGYAWTMAEANRQSLPESDITNDVDHFAVQAALGVALVLLPVAGALWSPGRRLFATSTALMAGYLGLVSFSWPGQPAGFSQAWSIVTLIWAVAIIVAGWLPTRDSGLSPASPRSAAATRSSPATRS
jgi:hypothetical protein